MTPLSILVMCGNSLDGAIFSKEYAEGTGRGFPVRVIPLEALQDFTKDFTRAKVRWKELGAITSVERAALVAQSRLLQAVKGGKPKDLAAYAELQAAVETAKGKQRFTSSEVQRRVKEGHLVAEFCRQFSDYLSPAKFVPWWCRRTRRIESGLICPTLACGLFCLLLSQLLLPEGMGICTACGKVFRRARVGQRFCSLRCGNLIRQQQKRARTRGGEK